MRVRVCRAVIPGIFEEERWIRREVSRGSFFATVDVSVRVWVRDYERDFDRVHICFANEGFCFGGVLRRRRREDDEEEEKQEEDEKDGKKRRILALARMQR